MSKTIDDYPLVLTASNIAEILQISRRRVYELMELNEFPLIRIGASKRVTKQDFLNWINKQKKAQ